MAEGAKSGRGCLLAVIGLGLFTVVACGCSGILAVTMGPGLLIDAMVADEPLEIEHEADPASAREIKEELVSELRSESRTTRLTGPELTRILKEQIGPTGDAGVTIADSIATVDLSVRVDEYDGWVNFHAEGALTMTDGEVTGAEIRDFDVSGWDLSPYLNDEAAIVREANRRLQERAAESEDVRKVVEGIESLRVAGDAVELVLTPEGVQAVKDPKGPE